MAQLVSRISGFFNPKPTQDAEATQRYLELTKKCMVEAQKMTLELSVSTSPKFNSNQCKYLADKLKMAVESADSFQVLLNSVYFSFPSPEETANCLEIFKLLYSLAMEVENFIQCCSKDAWIQAALTLRNVSEHVSLVGFNLMIWTVVFSEIKQVRARWTLTTTQVDGTFKAEVESVKGKASLDKEMLLRNLKSVLQTQNSTSTEHQLAVQILLLERLEQSRKRPVGDSPRSSQSRLSKTLSRTVKRMERLGTGSAGFVYRAKWLDAEVAQKTFYGPNIPCFETEVCNLDGLLHPNIVSLLCCAKNERECSIVMELMDEDLFSFIRRRLRSNRTREFPFGILEAVDIMHQVGEGMRYLHEMKIVHRDLKSANILVKCVKSPELEMEYVLAKVADFGISRTKEKSTTYSNQTLNTGTTRWMAPEVIKSCIAESEAEKSDGEELVMRYPFKCDIYSFAMVCFEILTGEMPFSTTSNLIDVKKMVLDGDRPPLPDECPSLLKRLIERCWSPDASQRPRFSEICTELRYMKCFFLSPSALKNVSPRSDKSNRIPIARNPICFKREAHVSWFVGLDIGTTHSGFAYAKGSHLLQMHVNLNYDYPYAESQPYCKALTALFYNQQAVPSTPHRNLRGGPGSVLKCAAWGQLAQLHFLANVRSRRSGQFYVPNFKLLLPNALNNHAEQALPPPLTANSVLADYLKHIGELALTQIKNRELREGSLGSCSVHWCVAVPSTWHSDEKARMMGCMEMAGLLSNERGTIADSVRVVRKAEAASFYCHLQQLRLLSLHVKDKIMVVDIGGWTVDIVVQEVIGSGNDFKVQEMTESLRGLCGGTFVDDSFMNYLFEMLKCTLKEYLRKDDPSYRLLLLNRWEEIKCAFGHEVNSSSDSYVINLPESLARKWEAYEREHGYLRRDAYSRIKLTQEDLESIFEPVVHDILRLISPQLGQVQGIKAMFVVGGFAGSPYLIQSIRSYFSREVQHIFSPSDPGSAIMQGAIALALS